MRVCGQRITSNRRLSRQEYEFFNPELYLLFDMLFNDWLTNKQWLEFQTKFSILSAKGNLAFAVDFNLEIKSYVFGER